MQKEKIALIALVIIVVAALSVFLIAVNTTIFENLFKEKVIISEGDCADVHYIGRYDSNNTVFDSSYTYVDNKSGGTPLKVFLSSNTSATSPKAGYNAGIIEGFREGLIGMEEGQTKIIGPIPPEKAYGANKFGIGAIFTSEIFAYGINQTVIVTNNTNDYFSAKWIEIENLTNFTMPYFIVNNLSSEDQTEMVLSPPPYYIWENSTSIINMTDTAVTVRTTPTKSTNITNKTEFVQWGEKQMFFIPDLATASWNDTSITIVCSPVVGQNYTYVYEYYTLMNITVTINSINGDIINITMTDDQGSEPQYLDIYKTFTFNRTYVMPRVYKDIPMMYISVWQDEIENAGYSLDALAGESLTFEVTVEKIYKTPQGTS